MARPNFRNHRKFRRLVALLRLPEPHVRGHVEYLWEAAYESGNPDLGDSTDVELAAGWAGDPGALAAALVSCGGDGAGLLDLVDGHYLVHDLYDHAPDYVRKRQMREESRRTTADDNRKRRTAADIGGHRRTMAENGTPPSPTPTPTPTPSPTPSPIDSPPPPLPGGATQAMPEGDESTGPEPAGEEGAEQGAEPPTGGPVDPARPRRRAEPPFDQVVSSWNAICKKLPAVSKLTNARRGHLRSRFQDAADFARADGGDLDPIEVFDDVFHAIYAEPFNLGDNDRGWRADFDYAIRPTIFARYWEKARDRLRLAEEAASSRDEGIIIGARFREAQRTEDAA